jgi:hypothetical protein
MASQPLRPFHVFLECLGKDRLTHLRQKINNSFRQYYPLSSSRKEWEAEKVVLYLTDPDIIQLHGWE